MAPSGSPSRPPTVSASCSRSTRIWPQPAISRPARSSTCRAPCAGAWTAVPRPRRRPPTSARWPIARRSPGADWLDLNVDEISPDSGLRAQAMTWLVTTVERTATVPVSIDSSDVAVLAAGVAASGRPRGPLMLNSASIERPEVLDIAADASCAVILAASGEGGMPADADERVANAVRLIEAAVAQGIAAGAVLRGPARAAGGGLAGRARPRDRDGAPAPRPVRRHDPPDRRPVQRLVRHARPQAAQRHLHRPVRRGRHRQRDHRPRRIGPDAGVRGRSRCRGLHGWPRTCCSGETRSVASTSWPSARDGWARASRAGATGDLASDRRPHAASLPRTGQPPAATAFTTPSS